MAEARPFDPTDPLKKVKGESSRQNAALRDYAYMGPSRSINKLLEAYKSSPLNHTGVKAVPTTSRASLGRWAGAYNWVARVDAFDELERIADEKKFLAEQKEWRQKRRDLIKATHSKLLMALQQADITEIPLRDVLRGLQVINGEAREEYRDSTLGEALETGDVGGGVLIYIPDNKRGDTSE